LQWREAHSLEIKQTKFILEQKKTMSSSSKKKSKERPEPKKDRNAVTVLITPRDQEKDPDEPEERSPYIYVQLKMEPDIHVTIPGSVLAVGAPGTGKTSFGRYLLYMIAPYVQHGLVICPNPQAKQEWDCVPSHFVVETWDPAILKAFMDDQKALGFPPAFLFFDDFIGTVDLEDPIVAEYMTQYRKYNTFNWYGAQMVQRAVPTRVRQCFRNVYAFKASEQHLIELLFNSWFAPWIQNARQMKLELANLPEHSCFWFDAFENTLNIVRGPDPDKKMPKFKLHWELNPPSKEEHEKQDMIEGAQGAGIPEALARVKASEEARAEYEKSDIMTWPKQVDLKNEGYSGFHLDPNSEQARKLAHASVANRRYYNDLFVGERGMPKAEPVVSHAPSLNRVNLKPETKPSFAAGTKHARF